MNAATKHIYAALAWLGLACFALLPQAQAVSPAPDGGYPGANTAEGDNALLNLTTGGINTAIGFDALYHNATGSNNTATGAGALFNNNAGYQNTATGSFALFSNGDGTQNTAAGFMALVANSIGFNNTALGDHALAHNNIGDHNIAVGSYALFAYTGNGTGGYNTAVGAGALENDTAGMSNTAVGAGAGSNVSTANNVICVGALGNNVSNSCYIGNVFGATSSGGAAVFVNSNGRLGTSTSSRRFKEDIKPMNQRSETLFSLKPVTFRYRKGVDPEAGEGQAEFGLVAEDVEKVNPDLVVRDKEGKPYSVRYDQVNSMLLNEFLKEHHKMEEQQKQIDALTSQLKEEAAQIQKVKEQTAEIQRARDNLKPRETHLQTDLNGPQRD